MTVDVEYASAMREVDRIRALLDDYSPDRSRRLQVVLYALSDILIEEQTLDHLNWAAAKLTNLDEILRLALVSMTIRRGAGR